MPFTIPNSAVASFPRQAVPYSTDLDVITQAAGSTSVAGQYGDGPTGVQSGCAVTAQGTPNMTVAVAAGVARVGGRRVTVASGNVTVTTAHASLDRIDLITVTYAGTKSIITGTAAASPVAPAITAGHVVLAAVFVPATDTAIGSTQIVDKRVVVATPDVENVTWYGAVGDGSTDDTAAIQAAIDTVAALTYGGVVYFPALTFAIGTGPLIHKRKVTLRGAGMYASKLYLTAATVAINADSGSPAANTWCSIEDLAVHGYADRNATLDDTQHLVYVWADRVTFLRVRALYSRQMSLKGVGTWECRAQDCVVENGHRDGINLTGSGKAVITGNSIKYVADDAIAYHIQAATTGVVSQQAIIANNRFEFSSGIKVLGATNCAISGNVGRFLLGYGCYLDYDATYNEGNKDVLGVTITNNSFMDIVNTAEVGETGQAQGIFVSCPAPSQGGLGYYPGMTSAGTGTAAVKGPTNNAWNTMDDPDTGAYGLVIANNSLMQTLEGLTNFSDAGFGNLWWRTGSTNPAMPGTIFKSGAMASQGILLLNGAMRDCLIDRNTIYGFDQAIMTQDHPVQPTLRVRGNKISRCRMGFEADDNPSSQVDFLIDGNSFDLDPLFESSERTVATSQPTGTWTRTTGNTAVCVYSYNTNGIYFLRNDVRNACNLTTNLSDSVIRRDNIIFTDTSVTSPSFGGVALTASELVENRIVQIIADPRLATYNQIRAGFDQAGTAMPTTGTWSRGARVENSTPSIVGARGQVTTGWQRLTTGSGNTANTDWIATKVETDVETNATLTTPVTVATSATETRLIGTTIKAGLLQAGTNFHIQANGVAGTHSSIPTATFRVRIGTTTLTGNIATSIVPVVIASQTAKPWMVDIIVTVRTAGASGTIIGNGFCYNELTTTAPNFVKGSGTTATVVVDTTAQKELELTFQWGTSNAANTLTVHNATIIATKG